MGIFDFIFRRKKSVQPEERHSEDSYKSENAEICYEDGKSVGEGDFQQEESCSSDSMGGGLQIKKSCCIEKLPFEASKLLETLNDKQKSAVLATEGRVRIIAGAGSGKTRVLAHRYAYIVEGLGIDPSHILCMTFTNKAAQEMKIRISKLVPGYHVNDYICTIHGFCVKFLRQEIYRIGFPQNFQIIDEEDSKAFAKEVMSSLGLERNVTTVRKFLESINHEKNVLWPSYVEDFMIPNITIKDEFKQNEFVQYLCLQKKYYALDFSDLIHFTLFILNTFPNVRDFWATKFNYIQVDEVQDCNISDWSIINALSSFNNNLFIVGDPDQAIYEWRGAKPKIFIGFKSDTDIILDQNYRSTPNILDFANSVITHNINRIKKDLVTTKSKSNLVVHYHAKNEVEEGEWIATQIATLIQKGAECDDFAILYRASYLSRYIEQALLRKGLSYTVWGGVRFFERKEIKDCLSYLKLVAFNDDMSFRRVINEPSRKFGKAALAKLEEIAKDENTSLYVSLKEHLQDKFFSKPAFIEFVNVIEKSKKLSLSADVPSLMDFVLDSCGLKEMYRLEEDEDRLENINELLHSMSLYVKNNAEENNLSLEKYLQDISLYTNADYKHDRSMIKLMTIHQAKGLEFPYVFVCGLSEGVFPSHKSIQLRKQEGLEEERRLMYVAITRAENALFLTESEGFDFTTKSDKFPSRFLLEVSKDLVEVIGNIDPALLERANELIRQTDCELIPSQNKCMVGDDVSHEFFGKGKVLECNKEEGCCKVKFDSGIRDISFNKLFSCTNHDSVPLKAVNLRKSTVAVDDVIFDKDGHSVVLNVYEDTIRVYNFRSENVQLLNKHDYYSIMFRPQKDTFYRIIKPSLKGKNNYFYVKDFYFSKNDLCLYGVGNSLACIETLGLLWINRLTVCSEEEFVQGCDDVKTFNKFRKEKPKQLHDEADLLPNFLKEKGLL